MKQQTLIDNGIKDLNNIRQQIEQWLTIIKNINDRIYYLITWLEKAKAI